MTLTILRSTGQIFCSMFLNLSLSFSLFFFFMIRLDYGFGGKNTEVKCPAFHILLSMRGISMPYHWQC